MNSQHPIAIGRPMLLPAYRAEARCPACEGAAWHIGRHAAECARCGLPLPIAPAEPVEVLPLL